MAGDIPGCTDSTACNYDDLATDDDGSCYNNDLGCGCDQPAADSGYDCDGNCVTDTDGDGTGNNTDAFPLDATETTDTDSDGIGDP